MRIAVMIYGPPGAGKGTQAKLLAHKLGLIHFDSGKYLESVVHDPANENDPMVQKERILFDTGKLLTPSWILGVVKEAVSSIGKTNFGIVFSGSPRTLLEAEGLMPLLEKIYDKKNVIPVVLTVKPETSIERNSSRLVCDLCSGVMLASYHLLPITAPACPVCGSAFRRRSLDNPETIKVRLKEYEERTVPIFAFLKERGYNIAEIDGERSPKEVFQSILQVLGVK